MNGSASGTMIANPASETVLPSQGAAGTVMVGAGSSALGDGSGTVAERGEDFAAALRSNAPAEISGYSSTLPVPEN